MPVTHLKIRKKPVHKLLSAALTKMDIHGYKSHKKSTFFKIMLETCFLILKLCSDKNNVIPKQNYSIFYFVLFFIYQTLSPNIKIIAPYIRRILYIS
jgi:hypothetical protein